MKGRNQFLTLIRVFALSVLWLLATQGQVFAQEPWPQVGVDVDGEAANDESGWVVSLSAGGTHVAIGAPLNDGNGNASGQVRVYENQNGTWIQVGADIDGEAVLDRSGLSVSLSSDGSIVAIGAPDNSGNGSYAGHVRVYENQNGTWVQVGADIDGDELESSGSSVSLSADGKIVAIGAPGSDSNGENAGRVRVYENQSGSWIQVGANIDGETAEDFSGGSVSLSANGARVAIGAVHNDGNGTSAGHVRVYENQGGTWAQVGADIDGEAFADQSGRSVSLNADGSILAVGAPYNDAAGDKAGHVRVYELRNGAWVQAGTDIDGAAAGYFFGYSVSVSAAGEFVAVGVPEHDGQGRSIGVVQIYENQDGAWVQVGADIDGESAGDRAGRSVSLSADGQLVAVGAPYNDDNGDAAGQVRMFAFPQFVPEVMSDNYSTGTNIPLVAAAPGVLGNDSDGNSDVLTAVLDDDSQISGTLDFNSDGSFVYTPTLDTNGSYTFTYRASDGALDSDVATVTIAVSEYGSVPLFSHTPDTTATAATTSLTYTCAVTVTDADMGDALVISATLLPGWLTFSDNGDGTALLRGVPSLAAVGEHPVSLLVTDLGGWSDTLDFAVSVSARMTYLPVILK